MAGPSPPVVMTAATPKATNIVWHEASVDRAARAEKRGHRSAILWFTGLSGSGKSTLANAVNAALFERGLATYVLDGDNVRHGLCKDLGFSDADREENIRRIGEVAKLFLDAGVIVLTAFVAADLDVCESRDPKGLYAKARSGAIKEFTGISSPYEAPESPELKIDTGSQELSESVQVVLKALEEQGVIPTA